MKKSFWTLCILTVSGSLAAQEKAPVIAPYNYMDIRDLYTDTINRHTALQPILHEDKGPLYNPATKSNASLFRRKLFEEHLLEYREKEYNVFVDFMPDFQVGRSSRDKTLWLNTRGVRVQANIGPKFYLESSFYENQGAFPVYIDSFVSKRRVMPGQGEVRGFGKKGFDYNYVNALLSYTPSKFFNATLGYGTNSYGDGYRSLILSDIGFSYPYLKLTGTLGKVQYTSMWSQFMDLQGKSYYEAYKSQGYPKKWGVFHFLDWNVSKKFSVGLFDAIIWPDADTTGKKRGFDWSYVNPIIFLRPAEYSVGSPDNSMLGINGKFRFTPKTMAYGQFVLDEFKLKEFFGGKNWWANKWSAQIGVKAYDAFKVPKLDLQGEINIVRPFTYSYSTTLANYAHYNQPLAHPLGANFKEFNGIASYLHKRWYVRGQLTYAKYGVDAENSKYSVGQDIFKSYDLRESNYNNKLGQGIATTLLYGQGTIAYVLNPKYNLRLEANVTARQVKSDIASDKEVAFTFGLRSSFRKLYYDF